MRIEVSNIPLENALTCDVMLGGDTAVLRDIADGRYSVSAMLVKVGE